MPKFLDVPQWYNKTGTLVNGQEEVCLVIHSPTEFNNMVNDDTWMGANVVIVDSPSAIPVSKRIVIPDTVRLIKFIGNGGVAISGFTDFNSSGVTYVFSGLTTATTNTTTIENMNLSFSATTFTNSNPFYIFGNNIENIYNCTVSLYGSPSTLYSYLRFGVFYGVNNCKNCTVTIYGIPSASCYIYDRCGYYGYGSMNGCTVSNTNDINLNYTTGTMVYYNECKNLRNCNCSGSLNNSSSGYRFHGYLNCENIYNCTASLTHKGTTTNTSGYFSGFDTCHNIINCTSSYNATNNMAYAYRSCSHIFGSNATSFSGYNMSSSTIAVGMTGCSYIVGCSSSATKGSNAGSVYGYYNCRYMSALTGSVGSCTKYDTDSWNSSND